MPAISTREAVERLTRAVEEMSPDDLAAFYDELFPVGSLPAEPVRNPVRDDRKAILDYLPKGLEIEEIVGLWSVAFPLARDVHYDEEAEMIRYREEPAESWAPEAV